MAPGKLLVDFGLRRAHGAEAGLLAARASYLAGFAGSATVLAAPLYGVPVFGTMAHSFVQAHDDETVAFDHFARSLPDNVILSIDTYDTEAAAEKVVALAPKLARDGIKIKGVRLDSGDLADHAFKVRRILDDGGLRDATIFASGSVDEYVVGSLTRAQRAHRRLRHRHAYGYFGRCALPGLRVQTGGIRRPCTAQTVRRKSALAWSETSLSQLR